MQTMREPFSRLDGEGRGLDGEGHRLVIIYNRGEAFQRSTWRPGGLILGYGPKVRASGLRVERWKGGLEGDGCVQGLERLGARRV